MNQNNDDTRVIVSYLTLRRVVGVLGVLLPPVLVIGCLVWGSCPGIKNSISDYYGTEMRDVFVGVLFAIGWFFFSYKGYARKDDIAGDLACLFALGVALFPATSASTLVRTFHFLSATALFGALSYFSLCLFTLTKPDVPPTPQKKVRNKIYIACGIIMLACIVLIYVYYTLPEDTGIADIKPVFWLESLVLWAFGVSWFIKGETLWKDPWVA